VTKERKQKTRPKKGKPIEIPVPKRRDVMDALDKATKPERKPD
jgi:hypothetical protein